MERTSVRVLSLTTALASAFAIHGTGMLGCGGDGEGPGRTGEGSGATGGAASVAAGGSRGGETAVTGGTNSPGSDASTQAATAGAGGARASGAGGDRLSDAGTIEAVDDSGTDAAASVDPPKPIALPVQPKPWEPSERCKSKAAQLLSGMTRANKAAQMVQADSSKIKAAEAASAAIGSVLSGGGSDPAEGNDVADWTAMVNGFHQAKNSLGIPLLYGIDAVHGNNNVSGAVVFPHNIGLGCTRNAELVKEVGHITALELRGTGIDWTFAPVVGPGRDERWGRTYETYSEDPALSAWLGTALIQGLQGTSLSNKESVLATAKHFAGDGVTEKGKDQGDVTLSEEEFQRLAIDGYQPAINAGVGSIMVSYSSYGGQKMTGYKKYLTDVLKETMGFRGFLVTDWNAIYQLPGGSASFGRPATVAQIAAAVNAGIDMIMESTSYSGVVSALASATTEIPDARLDDAVTRILTVKCELGMFDEGYAGVADPALTAKVGSPEHRDVARRAVRESLVLLKNDAHALPIPKSAKIHVLGSGADSLMRQCGGWTVDWQGLGVGAVDGGTGSTTTGTTILAGIQQLATGGRVTTGNTVAADSEYVILVASEMAYAEGKGDRTDLSLSATMASDAQLLSALPAGVKTVVVLLSGRPVILGDALAKADAWVAAWLPGTEGAGVADVLLGDYVPTGKLSLSWPKSMGQIPINVGDPDYDTDAPLYPFGYGLSY